MSGISKLLRTFFLILLVFAALFLCILRLLKLQIVDGAEYLALAETSYTSEHEVIATRGQIFDKNGIVLTSNRTVYKVILQKAFLIKGTENEVLNRTASVLASNNEKWNDSVPVTYEEPYIFTTQNESVLDAFKERIRVNPDATAENCITELKTC